MSFKFRSRTFLYLLVLLGLFVASQATIYTAVEYAHRVANPYESFGEGIEEVIQGVGLTFLLVPFLAGVAAGAADHPPAACRRGDGQAHPRRPVERADRNGDDAGRRNESPGGDAQRGVRRLCGGAAASRTVQRRCGPPVAHADRGDAQFRGSGVEPFAHGG